MELRVYGWSCVCVYIYGEKNLPKRNLFSEHWCCWDQQVSSFQIKVQTPKSHNVNVEKKKSRGTMGASMRGMIESPLVQLSIKLHGDTEAKPGLSRSRNVFSQFGTKWLLQLHTDTYCNLQLVADTQSQRQFTWRPSPWQRFSNMPLRPAPPHQSPPSLPPSVYLKLTKAVISTPLHGHF